LEESYSYDDERFDGNSILTVFKIGTPRKENPVDYHFFERGRISKRTMLPHLITTISGVAYKIE